MDGHLTYHDYEAPITEMQRLSSINQPFKLEFRKADGSRRIILKALLRGQAHAKHDANGPYKLQFIDTNNDQMGSCFIPLILALNDKKIVL